jgi:transposase
MTKKKSPKPKTTRNNYPPEFRHEAVLLAAKVGVAEAADKLGIQTSQIYAWRRQAGGDSEAQQVIQAMQTENAKLKRLLAEREEDVAILKKAAAYFAKASK